MAVTFTRKGELSSGLIGEGRDWVLLGCSKAWAVKRGGGGEAGAAKAAAMIAARASALAGRRRIGEGKGPELCNGNSQNVRNFCLRAPLKTVRDSNKRASYALK